MARRFYRRRYYRGFGNINVTLDAFLPPAVGGGLTLGTTLILRAFVPQFSKDAAGAFKIDEKGNPVEHWAFKYAGIIGTAAGIAGSVILGPFRGWGSAISGGVTALLAGLSAQLYNTVVQKNELTGATQGLGFMVARRSPYAQPAIYRGSRMGYNQLQQSYAQNPQLPENVSAFPSDYAQTVNKRAFGGSSFGG